MGYRKKVVYENLSNAFPEKTAKERDVIARKFYHHLCDIMVEIIKINSTKLSFTPAYTSSERGGRGSKQLPQRLLGFPLTLPVGIVGKRGIVFVEWRSVFRLFTHHFY